MMQIKGAMADLERLYLSGEHERSLDYARKNANRIRYVTEDLAVALRDGELNEADLALASSVGLRIVPETLDVTHPSVVLDWAVSNDLAPQNVTYTSPLEVAWRCHVCGNDWFEAVSDRVSHTNCPECAKTLERRARSLKNVSRRSRKASPAT